jgi:hypothetical protein
MLNFPVETPLSFPVNAMVSSNAKTVRAYLASLPAERRAAIAAVRDVIRENLPEGYTETMQSGMIAYSIPLSRFADTYNGAPLMYAALAAQKHHMAVYMMGIYADEKLRGWFETAYRKSAKRLDAGKCCVRFTKLEDLPLDVIGDAIARVPVDRFLELYQAARKPKKLNAPKRPNSM